MVELLVTMSILSGLVLMASAVYSGYVREADVHVLKQNLFMIRSAIQAFYSDHGRYPIHGKDIYGNVVSFLDNSSSELVQGPHRPRDEKHPKGYPKDRTRYLAEIPIDPTTNLADWKMLIKGVSFPMPSGSVLQTAIVTNVISANPEFSHL
jgi:type II secretory pathway pseudopilin PulG